MRYLNNTEVLNNLKEVQCSLCPTKRVGMSGPTSMLIVMKTWFVKAVGYDAEEVEFVCPNCVERALDKIK